MTQHQKHCPHYQEQFHQCWQFLRDATSVNPHELIQDPPEKHLKINSLNCKLVVQSQAVQNGATSVLQLPSSSSTIPLSPEAPVAPSSAIPGPDISLSSDHHNLLPQPSPPSNSHPPDVLKSQMHCLPAQYQDHLPELPLPVGPAPTPTFLTQIKNIDIGPLMIWSTVFQLMNFPILLTMAQAIGSDMEHKLPPWSWSNMLIWRLMAWQLMGNGKKSSAETTRLVHDVLLADDFKLEDLSGFTAETAIRNMDKLEVALTPDCQSMDTPEWDGWKTNVDIKIQVPLHEKCSKGNGKTFTVPDLMYHPLVSVIQAAFTDPILKWFHLTLFKCIWKSLVMGREQQLYDELYMSDAWNKAHNDLQKQWKEDGLE
ncbi:hypothetical protein V8B97DRAFT_2004510 [Scleroderma yunnanense]